MPFLAPKQDRGGQVRVVLVEDNGLFLDALSESLQGRGVDVVGQAGDVETALAVIGGTLPDVALLDIRLPPTKTDEGLQIATWVRRRHPQVGILLISETGDPRIAERLLSLGNESRAVGYLMKDRTGRLSYLVDVARRVAAGEVVIDPADPGSGRPPHAAGTARVGTPGARPVQPRHRTSVEHDDRRRGTASEFDHQ
jgi:DNA-binding NarL/FixJ family response regulator